MYRRTVFKSIEAQILRCEELGQHDDLTGMHREMFGDVEDCLKGVDFAPLDRSLLKERRWREISQHGFDVR